MAKTLLDKPIEITYAELLQIRKSLKNSLRIVDKKMFEINENLGHSTKDYNLANNHE